MALPGIHVKQLRNSCYFGQEGGMGGVSPVAPNPAPIASLHHPTESQLFTPWGSPDACTERCMSYTPHLHMELNTPLDIK